MFPRRGPAERPPEVLAAAGSVVAPVVQVVVLAPEGDRAGAPEGGCGGSLSPSIISTWCARLMAAANVTGLWMRTALLIGRRSPPV